MKVLIRAIVSFFVFVVDVIYRNLSYPRFYVLETIARVPYRKTGYKAPSLRQAQYKPYRTAFLVLLNSGKVINHLKNLATERQSAVP